MKRVLAALTFAAVAMTTLVTASWSQDFVQRVWQPKFRHHAAAVAGSDEAGAVGWVCNQTACYDSVQACGNGTSLVDTTTAFVPNRMALKMVYGLPNTVDTTMAVLSVIVSQALGTYIPGTTTAMPGAAAKALTLTLQASPNGADWRSLTAATATTLVASGDTFTRAAFYLGPVQTWGYTAYRFILTGVSGTTGCFVVKMSYLAPVVAAQEGNSF